MLTLYKLFSKSIILSCVYNILFSIPLFYYYHKNYGITYESIFEQISLLLVVDTLLFLILLTVRALGNLIICIIFMIGGGINYFLLSFGKTLDHGVITDLLSIEKELIFEYISLGFIFFVVGSGIIGWLLCRFLTVRIPYIVSIPFILALSISSYNINSYQNSIEILEKNQPFSIIHDCYLVYVQYLKHMKQIKEKKDLTEQYKFEYSPKGNKPLIIIMVIGESMRGDLISLNGYNVDNMPLLGKRKNLISLRARASGTSTKIALPYMLTSVETPNYNDALSEKSLISIFKHMGFRTAWIGSQGLFGIYETTFASHALEADSVISRENIKMLPSNYVNYDSDLLPVIDQQLAKYPNDNQFIVVHFMGSHWNFTHRYPQSFGNKFMPVCTKANPWQCTPEEVKNAYFNSITFSDFVLDQILKRLENKNAFVFYSSDHGISLGENDIFGNAYEGPNPPAEQLDIAMFAWASNQFNLLNSEVLHKINQKKDSLVSHNNIFHSILDCTNVSSKAIKLELSVCH